MRTTHNALRHQNVQTCSQSENPEVHLTLHWLVFASSRWVLVLSASESHLPSRSTQSHRKAAGILDPDMFIGNILPQTSKGYYAELDPLSQP